MDEELVSPESEARLLWRRMFSDCLVGFRRLLLYVMVAALPVAIMFAVEIASSVQGDPSLLASEYGIFPRKAHSMLSVFFLWPWLHFGWSHFMGNAPFCFILGFLCCLRGVLDFVVIWIMSMWIGGLGVWLTGGAQTVHAGASGVIMGFFGALLLRVVFEKSLVSLIWALVVAIFYGSLFYIMIPSSAYSWQGHLFGFLGGVAAAAVLGTCNQYRMRNQTKSQNEIGSSSQELGVFDDFQLEGRIDRLADEDAMMKEVQEALK